MKKRISLLIVLFLLSTMVCQASYYYWDTAIISGKDYASDDPGTIIIPEFSHPYGVAVAGNGRVWTASYFYTDRYDMAILVYHPEEGNVDTVGPEIVTPEGNLTLGHCRFFATLGNGNIAYGDWKNDKILVFNQDTYEVVALSNSSYNCNVGGGIEAFVYSGAQYYLTQQIMGSEIVIWDSTISPIDTLHGSSGGRNLAATEDGSIIISPTIAGNHFTAFRGNPVDGYTLDTLYLADLGIDMGNLTYVSSGPDDYFWLFSRDAINDGVYVVDPYNNFDIKLYTNTDNSIISTDNFSLSMAVDNQYLSWLEQGLIDSSEVYTEGEFMQPWILRAPCQVAYGYKGGSLLLYMADYYGYTLKSWTIWPNRPFKISTGNTSVFPGDTATINIHAMFPDNHSYYSLNMALTGFLQHTELVDLYKNDLLTNNNWNISYHQNNDTLYVEASGSTAIDDAGSLFHFDLAVPDSVDMDHIPVNFNQILLDGVTDSMIVKHGSITINPPYPVLSLSFVEIEHDFGNIILNNNPDTPSYDFTIHNTGNDTLTGIITYPLEWLTISQDTFVVDENDSIEITVTATTSPLPVGDYSGRIRVYSNGGDASGLVQVSIYSNSKMDEIPSEYHLYPNFPNPFNPTTKIRYSLKENTKVKLSVFNIYGEKVAQLVNSLQSRGNYDVVWDASMLPSGVYIYQLQAGDFIDNIKCMLIK